MTSASAKPSYPLLPTVCIAVALTRGSAASTSLNRRMPCTSASLARGVDHLALAHDVVDDDQAAAAGQPQRPGEVVGGARLVGVDEDQVERPAPSAASCGSVSSARPDAQLDDAGQAGAGDVGAGDLGVLGSASSVIRRPPARQRPRQPDRAVAAERADLQDPPGALQPGQQVQQLALVRRDTWIAGSPAASLARSAASSAGRPG